LCVPVCAYVCARVHACANNVKANTYAKYLRETAGYEKAEVT